MGHALLLDLLSEGLAHTSEPLLHGSAGDPQFIRYFLVTLACCHGIEDHFPVSSHLSFAELLLEDADEPLLVDGIAVVVVRERLDRVLLVGEADVAVLLLSWTWALP